MRERPILFSAPMVNAILAGRKTMTRRIIPNHARGADRVLWVKSGELWPGHGEKYVGWVAQVDKLNGLHLPLTCRQGLVGDHLWVREHLKRNADGAWEYAATPGTGLVAHGSFEEAAFRWAKEASRKNKKSIPSIYMPRWASRITLVITGIRVERLQDISADDAKAEGVEGIEDGEVFFNFISLWESINGKGSWAKNPFVWAISFRRVDQQSPNPSGAAIQGKGEYPPPSTPNGSGSSGTGERGEGK